MTDEFMFPMTPEARATLTPENGWRECTTAPDRERIVLINRDKAQLAVIATTHEGIIGPHPEMPPDQIAKIVTSLLERGWSLSSFDGVLP